MLLLCGLRAENVGADTHNYMDYALGRIDSVHFGVVYELFRNITKALGGHANMFLMILAAFTYIPLYYVIKIKSLYPMVSVLIYMIASSRFYLETFNISRQSIAIIFLLASYCYFVDKKYFGVAITYLCAVMFHVSSLFVLPFFLIDKISLPNLKLCSLILLISVIVGLSDITAFITELLDTLFSLSDSDSGFASFGRYGGRTLNLEWNIVGKLSHCIPCTLLALFTYSKSSSKSFLYKMLFFGAVILNLMLTNRFCERFASMFLISQILVIPIALSELTGFRKLLLKYFIAVLGMLYVIVLYQQYNTVGSDYYYVIPYHLFFE